jgi:hypothetical protein
MRSRIVTVNDKMQQGYCYEVSAPAGRAFDRQFRPDLTPKQNGAESAGYIGTIRAAGSSGIAATTWAGECPRRTPARSAAGRRCSAMSGKSGNIASPATRRAGGASAKRSCTGRMTAGESRGRIVGSHAVARHLGAFGCPSGRERCGGAKSGGTNPLP